MYNIVLVVLNMYIHICVYIYACASSVALVMFSRQEY